MRTARRPTRPRCARRSPPASALKAFVDVNPISILATASRGLMEGTASAGDIGIVLATSAALTAVFAPLTVRLYRSRG